MSDLAPVVEDLSTFLLSGRAVASPPTDPRLGPTVREGMRDGVEAEQLGFRRAFLSERYDLKEAGALLGGIG
jgi:5,10-methylenetetrahydromethanopterin reductase